MFDKKQQRIDDLCKACDETGVLVEEAMKKVLDAKCDIKSVARDVRTSDKELDDRLWSIACTLDDALNCMIDAQLELGTKPIWIKKK